VTDKVGTHTPTVRADWDEVQPVNSMTFWLKSDPSVIGGIVSGYDDVSLHYDKGQDNITAVFSTENEDLTDTPFRIERGICKYMIEGKGAYITHEPPNDGFVARITT
jgi:hypothetical protein